MRAITLSRSARAARAAAGEPIVVVRKQSSAPPCSRSELSACAVCKRRTSEPSPTEARTTSKMHEWRGLRKVGFLEVAESHAPSTGFAH